MNSLIESTTYLTAAAASFGAAASLTWLTLSAFFRLLPGRRTAGLWPASLESLRPASRPRIVHRRLAPVVRAAQLRIIAGGKNG